jgi:HD-like signal output (HDOD) protein
MANTSLLELIDGRVTAGEVDLPARNQIAQQLQDILHRENYEIQEVLRLVEQDPALTTEVLRVANSPFYGGLSTIGTIKAAVVRIGGPEVVRLAISATEKEHYRVRDPHLGKLMAPLWNHTLGVALGCRWLARRLGYDTLENEAFISGLLHDVGKLLLVRVCDDLITAGEIERQIPAAVMTEILETGHCRHGAALMQHWGLPTMYQDIALHHHDQELDTGNTLLLIVRLANLACRSLGIGLVHDASIDLAASEEAYNLNVRDITLAELAIMLEDSLSLV